jgi:hypothetical protein
MRHWRFLVVACLALPLSVAVGTTAEPEKPRLRLLVPAYFYPAGDGLKEWQKLGAAAKEVSVVAIVNPASGPGTKIDENYRTATAAARKNGVTLIGYVSTSYGKRPIADVKADIDRWIEFYPDVQGFFFDEQASGKDLVNYYAELATHARKKINKALLVANPGTICAEEYLKKETADVFCVFENFKGFEEYKCPAWAEKMSTDRFATLPYAVAKSDQMGKYVEKAAKGFGYVYVTDDDGDNPWDRLPVYWADLVGAVKKGK